MNPATLSALLAEHPWLAEAHAGNHGALVLLNRAGHAALRQQGRHALLQNLQAHLAAHAVDRRACTLRLLDAAPGELGVSQVDQRLATARPDRPIVLAEHGHDGRWTLNLQLPLELVQLDGHFVQTPIVPGVLQVGWALAHAAPRLRTSLHCREMEAVKFQYLLRPGDRVALSLRYDAQAADDTHGKLHFAYHLDGAHCSSGRLLVTRAHD